MEASRLLWRLRFFPENLEVHLGAFSPWTFSPLGQPWRSRSIVLVGAHEIILMLISFQIRIIMNAIINI